MDEEHVPPASPLNKSGLGGSKRSESPRSSTTSGGKVVPHYMRVSTGSCHEFCKHGKQEEHLIGVSRPWRAGKGREEAGVLDSKKGTVVVKSRPSADHKVLSPSSKEIMGPQMSTATENIDVRSEQNSLQSNNIVTGQLNTSDGPRITLLDAETVEGEIGMSSENVTVVAEGVPSDVKDLKILKKPSASSQDKPSFRRSPSPVSSGSSVGRSADVRKSLEGRNTLDGRKASEGRKFIDGKKNVEGKNAKDENKGFDENESVILETKQKCEINADNAENSSKGSMSKDEMKRCTEVSQNLLETEGYEESKNLKFKGSKQDVSLGNVKINGKSELLSKKVDVPKPTISKKKSPSPSPLRPIVGKPPSPLHPSSAPSRNPIAAKSPSPLHPSSATSRNPVATKLPSSLHTSSSPSRSPIAAKPPSRLHPSSSPSPSPLAAKPPSPLHPSSGTHSKTTVDNQADIKLSISKPKMKKVDIPTGISPSLRPVNGEEINTLKKVRVVRVVSTIRRQRKNTNVAAKDLGDEGLKEDTAEAIKIPPAKNSVGDSTKEASSDSQVPLAPPVSKYTIKSRISYVPSRPKNSPSEAGQKIATKEASSSGVTKTKAVELQSEKYIPRTLRSVRVPLIGETAKATRRSLKKRISAGSNAIEKSSSGIVLSRRPSARQKKNVQVLFNKVIEETASRLVRTSKSKVLALVGAFETVISIQRKSSAVTTVKSKKVSSSSSKTSG